jgi:hypothetical protein
MINSFCGEFKIRGKLDEKNNLKFYLAFKTFSGFIHREKKTTDSGKEKLVENKSFS